MQLQVRLLGIILLATIASFSVLMPPLSKAEPVPEAESLRRGMNA